MLTAPNYDQVVSLGRACQPAFQFKRLFPDCKSHVFDWIITTDTGLVDLIASGVGGFFDRDRLVVGTQNCIVDRVTDTRFLHEFPEGTDFDEQYAKNEGRYAMLVERWRSLLASDERVLFVRQHGWDEDMPATAIRLRDTIAAHAPRLSFSLLYLTEMEERDWSLDGIVNLYLRQPEPYVWKGDDDAWAGVLQAGLARPPKSFHKAR